MSTPLLNQVKQSIISINWFRHNLLYFLQYSLHWQDLCLATGKRGASGKKGINKKSLEAKRFKALIFRGHLFLLKYKSLERNVKILNRIEVFFFRGKPLILHENQKTHSTTRSLLFLTNCHYAYPCLALD